MARLTKRKFSNKSLRAQWWNYGRIAAYFITICTKNRKRYFGKVVDKKMVLSQTGMMEKILRIGLWIDEGIFDEESDVHERTRLQGEFN